MEKLRRGVSKLMKKVTRDKEHPKSETNEIKA